MGDPRIRLDEIAREQADYTITAVINFGAQPFVLGGLATLTLDLYDVATNAIVNSVAGANILNSGRGTVDGSGNLVIKLLPEDNPILDPTRMEELHVALVRWTFNGGASKGWQDLEFRVRNEPRIT